MSDIFLLHDQCGSFKSCSDCSKPGHGCHWCGDSLSGGCYSSYNYLACVWSPSCEELEKCQRSEPEYIGTSSRAASVKTGAIGLTLFSIFFLPIMLTIMIQSKSSSRKTKNEEVMQPLLETNDDLNEDLESDNDNPTTQTSFYESKPSITMKILFWGCSLLGLLVLLLTGLYIYISPQIPDFSVCTSEVEFQSLLKTFINFDFMVQGDYLLQASVYNPNKFTLAMVDCKGYFKYKGNQIGTFSVDYIHGKQNHETPISVPGGSIYDIQFVAALDMPLSTAVEMELEFTSKGDLILEVGADFKVGLEAFKFKRYDFQYSLPAANVSLAELDDKRCKCKH